MIVCRKCSRRHPDGTEFCACGAYLEFDGEVVGGPTPGPGGPSSTMAPPTAAPSGWQAQEPAERAAPRRPPESSEPSPWSAFGGAGAGAEPPRPAGGIDAVLPDSPGRPAATQPVWVEPGARAGDVACRQCGTPNGPERFFCRHCGASLTGALDNAGATQARGTPWWKRMFRGATARAGSTDPTAVANRVHGLARGNLSGRTMLFRTGGVVLVIGSLLAFLGPWKRPVMDKGRELLGAERHQVIEIDEDDVHSVASDPGVEPAVFPQQGAESILDRFANTAWATKWIASGPGFEELPTDEGCQPVPSTDSELVVEFPTPRDVSQLQILGGRTDGDEAREQFARPRVLEVQYGLDACAYVVLDDVGELVTVSLDLQDVEGLVISVVGIYEADPPSDVVEISEIVVQE